MLTKKIRVKSRTSFSHKKTQKEEIESNLHIIFYCIMLFDHHKHQLYFIIRFFNPSQLQHFSTMHIWLRINSV